MNRVSVREAKEQDAAAILKCLALAFEPYRAMYSEQGFYDTVLTPESIGRRMSEMKVFVSTTDSGDIVGTIACKADGEEGHLRGMAVRPEWQGCGVSAQLLQAAEHDLRDQGCARITLDTTAPLKRAMRFYERHGYRASGKVSDFFAMALYEYEKVIR
jgi:GNAT superfamily N-acetyltransferase